MAARGIYKAYSRSMKKFVYLGTFIGGVLGGYLPVLWGDDAFGGMSIFLGFVGGIAGIWAAFWIGKRYQ